MNLIDDFRDPARAKALLTAIEGHPFEVVACVEDIGANGCPWPQEDEIQTNFQAKFERKGLPVHGVVLRRRGE